MFTGDTVHGYTHNTQLKLDIDLTMPIQQLYTSQTRNVTEMQTRKGTDKEQQATGAGLTSLCVGPEGKNQILN